MTTSDLLVPARYYARIPEVLARDAIDFPNLLKTLRISPKLMTEPDAMLRVSQVDHLIQKVFEKTQRTDLAFDLGKMLTASAHSFVGFGMLNSDNLDQALQFEARYFRLIMPSFRMQYRSSTEYGEMVFTPTAAMSHICLSFHLEAIGIAALREISDLTGNKAPSCRLDLSIAEPAHVKRYAHELRDVSVRFATDPTPCVRLRLSGDPRAMKIAMADTHARRLAEERCRTLVQQVAGGGRFADWVAMTLREVPDALPSLDQLAELLNLSKRTLNRYLEREGTSFRELAVRIQHELACERLSSGMSATEVAYSLGFTDLSNFSRAFKAKASYSPGKHAIKKSSQKKSAPH